MSCRQCCNMFGVVLNNSCTNVLLLICENFNEIEFCTKLGCKISVWYCGEQVVFWCGCKMKIINFLLESVQFWKT